MTGVPEPRLDVSADAAAVAERIAAWLVDLAQAKHGFNLCQSGGSTPKALYARLAQPPYRDAFPCARTHLSWGDERFVVADDALSNYKMVRNALLEHAPIPAANIHPVPTEGETPEQAASDYAQTLKAFYGQDQLDPARPLFDVNLLGLGEDGHTASLCPGPQVLTEREWAAALIGAKAEPRITLTYPALDSGRHAALLVSGAGKAETLRRLRRGEADLPAAHLHPTGKLRFFSDKEAALP